MSMKGGWINLVSLFFCAEKEVKRLFKRFGKMFIQGAKAELEANGPDLDGLLKAAGILLEGLALSLILFGSGHSGKKTAVPSTVIVNNYIQKGD